MNHLRIPVNQSSGRVGAARFIRRIRYALLCIVAGVFMSTAAFAFWPASGTGTGAGSATTLQQVTIGDVTIPNTLRPGGTANVSVQITNPNAFPVTISSLTAGAITSGSVGCGDSPLNVTGVSLDVAGLPGSISANSALSYIITASMSTASVSACQGATFRAPLTLEVKR